jgi:hypothetical protein
MCRTSILLVGRANLDKVSIPQSMVGKGEMWTQEPPDVTEQQAGSMPEKAEGKIGWSIERVDLNVDAGIVGQLNDEIDLWRNLRWIPAGHRFTDCQTFRFLKGTIGSASIETLTILADCEKFIRSTAACACGPRDPSRDP